MLRRALPISLALVLLGSCGGSAAAPGGAGEAKWKHFKSLNKAVDVAGPRQEGRLVAIAAGRLFLLDPSGTLSPFARGVHGFAGQGGGEPYMTVAPQRRPKTAGCTFHRDDVFVLQPGSSPAVVRVTAAGRAKKFASLPKGGFLDGIAFDGVGRFGHRLIVGSRFSGGNAIYAIDCAGRVKTVAAKVPRLEGGMAVAPASFGRFAGDAIAADEHSGHVYAIGPKGGAHKLPDSGFPAGGDIGVEALGFAPGNLAARDAYLADLGAPGSPTHGTNSVLRVRGNALSAAGVKPGDLLVATEASAKTVAIRCAATCTVRRVATGPTATHAEGHIVFSSPR